jgi:hypothetical protein
MSTASHTIAVCCMHNLNNCQPSAISHCGVETCGIVSYCVNIANTTAVLC